MHLDSSRDSSPLREGLVFRKTQGSYSVDSGDQVAECAISSKLRKHLEQWMGISASTNVHREVKKVHEIREVDPVAIGDRVRYQPGNGAGGMIVEVLPRRNRLSRVSPGPRPDEQVIVANADQVIAVMAVRQPVIQWPLLDRYLAAAESAGIPAVVCLTKTDLAHDAEAEDVRQVAAMYRRLAYPVLWTSVVDGQGLDEFAAAIGGKLSVLVGKSGVGKSSLLNAVQPGLGLRVNEISQATGKGKHTTSHLEMFALQGGGWIVDTPGMREFALWPDAVEGGLAGLFVEMRPFVGRCRFGLDCTHTHEPACAVKRAVQAGEIAERRYESYVKLLAD